MIDIYNIYKKLPFFFQFFLFNLKAYLIYRRRFRKHLTKKIYKNILCEDNYTKSEIIDNTNIKLKKFFINANQTKFWRDRFKKYNIDFNNLNFIRELEKLPILTKQDVKNNYDDIINKSFLSEAIITNTSGTTGSGLKIPITNFSETYTWLYWWNYRKKHGIKFNQKCAILAGLPFFDIDKKKPPYWITNIFTNQLRISIQHMNYKTIELITNKIKKEKIKWIHGNPSAITHFAHLCISGNIKFDYIEFVSIGAETLLKHQCQIMKKLFKKAKIIQHYGLSEGVANIHQNINNELIVDENYAYLELEKINGLNYKIIGTNHHNHAFPLIRYQTDDILSFNDINKQIPRKIDSIDGRIESYIRLKNGVRLGRLDFIFKDMVNVIEAQIIQRKDFTVDINVVKSKLYNQNDELLLRNEIVNKIGKEITYNINYLTKIKKTKNGKLRFVISEIKHDY